MPGRSKVFVGEYGDFSAGVTTHVEESLWSNLSMISGPEPGASEKVAVAEAGKGILSEPPEPGSGVPESDVGIRAAHAR